MMSMHTIRVTYDPTTRRISLVGNDNYGGATTDDNSVNIIVTGIVPDGENFKARIDFGVQVRTDDHIYNHPFVLLEQNGDEWSCVIPNPILRAAGQARCRLPIQLITASDSYVINSRNTIMLEVTQAVDGEDDGSEIPPYDVPEWTIPEGQTAYYEDVHVVELTYDPLTREMKVANEKSKYGGSTIDCRSVAIQVTGITPIGNDFSVRVDFAMPVKTAEGVFVRPFVVMEQINNAWRCMVPQPVLMAARELKKLPFQLVMRHSDTVINTRNTITLEITRAINAMESIQGVYGPYIMYRNDTWEWIEDFAYSTGAVVTYDGDIYVATQPSTGQQPSIDSEYWEPSVGETIVTLNGHRINDPEFYAPLLSGISGQYLESRGSDNSPEWVSKVTEIDTDSNGIPTVTAVKGHVAASVADERERANRALEEAISGEANIRANADTALSGRITTLETDTINTAGTYLTKSARSLSHNTTSRTDTTTSPDPAAIANGGQFYIVDTVSTDNTAGGHVTGVNKTKITLPTYAAAAGIELDGLIFKHTNAVTADSTGKGTASKSATVKMDAQGHITALTDQDIQIAESQVTNLPDDLAGKAPKDHAGQDTQQNPYPYGKAAAQAYGHVQFDGTISGNRTDVTISEKGIKDFVNSSINALAAYYITKNAAGDPFATHAELMASTTVYSGGQERTPTRNDYCIVMADETNGNGDSTRYTYDSDSTTYNSANWAYQYTFNKQFTAAQLAALDSGITTDKVNTYDVHVSNTNNPHSVTKAQVGLTNVLDYGMDAAPLSGSNNYVKSGGVYSALSYKIGSVSSSGPATGFVQSISVNSSNKTQLDVVRAAKPEITITNSGSGDVVTGISVDPSNGHALTVSKNRRVPADLPYPSSDYIGQAIIIDENGTGYTLGEAGKVDDVRINGNEPANSIVRNKIAVIPLKVTKIPMTEVD